MPVKLTVSQLLLNEDYINIPVPLALALGLSKSALIKKINAWCLSNQQSEKRNYFKDGYWWTRGTYDKWQKQMPYLGCAGTIKRIVLQLEKEGLLISAYLHDKKIDREKWYRVDHQALERFCNQELAKHKYIGTTCDDEENTHPSTNGTTCDDGQNNLTSSNGTTCDDDLYLNQIKNQQIELTSPPTPQGEREGVNQEKDSKTEESDQNPPVPCQKSSETVARTEDAHETNSPAVPQKTQPEEFSDPMGDRYRAGSTLPLWRSKFGLNGWSEEFIEIFLELNEKAFNGEGWTRPGLIGFLKKNEKTDAENHDLLIAHAKEVQKEIDRRSSQASQPHSPKYRARTAEEEAELYRRDREKFNPPPPHVQEMVQAAKREMQARQAAAERRFAS